MSTFVSTVTWHGHPRPRITDVQETVSERSRELWDAGLHSVIYIPDGSACSAVLITTCDHDDTVANIAAQLCPAAQVSVETVAADPPAMPLWLGLEERPAPPEPWMEALLADVLGPVKEGLRAVEGRRASGASTPRRERGSPRRRLSA